MLSLPTPSPRSRPTRTAGALLTALLALPLLLMACSGGATSAPSGSAAASAGPSASTGGQDPAAAALAATIPTQVGDVPLTVESGTLPDLKDDLPNYAQLVQRLANAFIQPDDVVAAVGKPTAGGDDPTVGALEIQGAPPGGLGLLGMMDAWISSIPGATSENTNVGKPCVKVTFSDGSLPLYYYLYDSDRSDLEESDTLYFVRTADETLAEDALSQLP